MKYIYSPKGVCPELMTVDAEDGIVRNLHVVGGNRCGNQNGIEKLVEGMKMDEAIQRLEGVRCGTRATSCPDQIACALKQLQQLQSL